MSNGALPSKYLLGWLGHDDAIRFLTTQCVHEGPFTDADAEALWQPYRVRVEALPERPRVLPVEYQQSKIEREHVKDFLKRAKRRDPSIDRVVKVDLMDLAVHQLVVVLPQSEGYAQAVSSGNGWRKRCLNAVVKPRVIQTRQVPPNQIVWDLPHGEFRAVPVQTPNGTQIGITEFPNWVTVAPCDGRLMLWAGYHRSHARVSNSIPGPEGAADARAVPVVLVSNVAGPQSAEALTRASGLRPPLFRDFFDEDFFCMVQLRRRRYEIQATFNGNQATVTPVLQPFA